MRHPPKSWKRSKGFTLAELLIALVIIGEIATFTIPKILNSSQNGQKIAIAKEFMGTIGAIYTKFKMEGTLSTKKGADFLRELNYVKVDSTTVVDDAQSTGWGSLDCATWWAKCYKLHNGAIVGADDTGPLGGTSRAQTVWVLIDVEGSYQGDHNAFWIQIHGDGWMTTDWLDRPNLEPTWFQW